jgi:hypothetical protein
MQLNAARLTRFTLWLAVVGLVALMIMLQRPLMPPLLQLLFWAIVVAIIAIQVIVTRKPAEDGTVRVKWSTDLIVYLVLGAFLYVFAAYIFPGGLH